VSRPSSVRFSSVQVIASTFNWCGSACHKLATNSGRWHSVVTRRRTILGTVCDPSASWESLSLQAPDPAHWIAEMSSGSTARPHVCCDLARESDLILTDRLTTSPKRVMQRSSFSILKRQPSAIRSPPDCRTLSVAADPTVPKGIFAGACHAFIRLFGRRYLHS
jgi:hypothetical protein